MPKTLRILFALCCLALLALAPAGCGSDDDPINPGGGDPVDDIIPLVLDINPGHRSYDVPLDQDITITFSEAMDPATADGSVVLTLGAVTGLTWNAANTVLTVAHDTWADGRPVGVTVGTGLTDAAGNALPEPFAVTFYTDAAAPTLLDFFMPFDDAGGALPAGQPVFVFSERMDLLSVYNNTTISEPGGGKAVPDYQVGTWNGDVNTVLIKFLSPLDVLTTYRIGIAGEALTHDGTPLGSPVSVTFTTGAVVDDEPPYILSVTPAVDSVAPRDLESVVIDFNEPVDPYQVQPREMSALLAMYAVGDPVWNTAGDRLTLHLQRPLPAGVRLHAIFRDETFRDLSGNYNTVTDSVSFTTAGTASLFPVRDDVRLYYDWEDEGTVPARQFLQDISGDDFVRVMRGWDGDGYDTVLERWEMTMSAAGLFLRGFDMDGATVAMDPPLPLLVLPVQSSWSGTATGSDGTRSFTMTFQATASEAYDESISTGRVKAAYMRTVLEDCRDVEIAYAMTRAGETLPFETGNLFLYFAPGLGLYGFAQEGYEYDGETQTDSWDMGYYLMGLAMDDRFENPQ